MIVQTLGMNGACKVFRGLRQMNEIVDAAIDLLRPDGDERSLLARRALAVTPWSLQEGQVVPHVLVESAIRQARGLVAFGALVAACADARRPAPWLTNALADAYLTMTAEGARILASAGYPIAGASDLLDLRAAFAEAEAADQAFLAAFEADVRAGRLGVPEEE
jgi:hypothetical protein